MGIRTVEIPLLHGYWDRPVGTDRGDKDAETVYQAVGQALTSWEGVEGEFARLFGNFIQSHSYAAQRVYGTLQTATAKTDALRAAAEVAFHDLNVDEIGQNNFELLVKHLANATARRNDIAHATVTRISIDGDQRGHFLVPPHYATKKTLSIFAQRKNQKEKKHDQQDKINTMAMAYRYTSADILNFANKFILFSMCVSDYSLGLLDLTPTE